MSTMTGFSRPFTRANLEALPDDGRRQEIIDGVLFVTPTPDLVHQIAVGGLVRTLDDACPPGFTALLGPDLVR